ncbi:MAG: tyrosine--tRNA ligase [Elusimicrobia bacterium]|nr:tyrosine--tRNA ligase [Elusimicrobiota bacterium]
MPTIDPSLTRGCVELVSPAELEKKLAKGRPLRVKLGVDPTSPDLHLGHTVVFQKLRAFQDLGHKAVLIIGDFTARVGDPSGRDSTRPALTREAIDANAATYKDQAFKVLRDDRVEVRYNSEWLEPFMREGFLAALQRHTVQQVLAREDFSKRMAAGTPVTLLEMMYPLMQGYDSVAVEADVELGGNDQLFNLLMGRRMQEDAGQEPQVALTLPLLVGLDGQKKMSKSYGNSVGLNEPAREIFGKLMRISDEAMLAYYELLTTRELAAVKALHPMEAKKALAAELTSRYHGEAAGPAERRFFEETFSQKQTPTDIPVVRAPADGKPFWSQFLVSIEAVKSRKEAQRLLEQGGVYADDAKIADQPLGEFLKSRPGVTEVVLKVGKHRFYKIVFP